MKILFADDQLPLSKGKLIDSSVTDQEIINRYAKEYPISLGWPRNVRDDFIKDFPKLRQTVLALEEAGYDVDLANTSEAVTSLISKNHYDVAIVDLNWSGDKTGGSRTYGYKICEQIEEANKADRLKGIIKPTYKIMHSTLFSEKNIMNSAAAKGLPVMKNYTKEGNESLKTIVRYFEERLRTFDPARELEQEDTYFMKMIQGWDDLRKKYDLWFNLTLVLVAVGSILALSGIIGVYLGYTAIGTVNGIVGALTSIFSGFILKEMGSLQEAVERKDKDWMDIYNKSVDSRRQAQITQ